MRYKQIGIVVLAAALIGVCFLAGYFLMRSGQERLNPQVVVSEPPARHLPPLPPAAPPPAPAETLRRAELMDFDLGSPTIASRHDVELLNVSFAGNVMHLNGRYEFNVADLDGYRAVFKTPTLNYGDFTVAFRIKPEEVELHATLLFGGTSYRWMGFRRSADGNLQLTFNNNEFVHDFGNAAVAANRWATIACGVNLRAHLVVTYFNGRRLSDVTLPADFNLDVTASDADGSDRCWTFTNYSNGAPFCGSAERLIIYDRLLSDAEFEAIPIDP
jgi:hypothetical protein